MQFADVAPVAASAGGLGDEVLRSIPVVPLGYPQVFERSGQISGTSGQSTAQNTGQSTGQASHELDLSRARAACRPA